MLIELLEINEKVTDKITIFKSKTTKMKVTKLLLRTMRLNAEVTRKTKA